MKKNKFVYLVGIFCFIVSCTSNFFIPDDWTKRDVPKHNEIEDISFSFFNTTEKEILIKQLDYSDYVIIKHDENGYELAIRGVYTSLGGSFSVVKNDDNSISVFYVVLGEKEQSFHKTALKIKTTRLPAAVYVFCSNVL